MEDFKMIINKCIELLSVQIPILGHDFSLLSIIFAMSALSICISFVYWIFTH